MQQICIFEAGTKNLVHKIRAFDLREGIFRAKIARFALGEGICSTKFALLSRGKEFGAANSLFLSRGKEFCATNLYFLKMTRGLGVQPRAVLILRVCLAWHCARA